MYTIEQYNALCAAIAQGVHIVKYGDKEVTYRSLDEMKNIRKEMEVQLGISKAAPTKKFASFTKGLK